MKEKMRKKGEYNKNRKSTDLSFFCRSFGPFCFSVSCCVSVDVFVRVFVRVDKWICALWACAHRDM